MNEMYIKDINYKARLKDTVIIGFVLRVICLFFILKIGIKFSDPYFIFDDIAYDDIGKRYLNLANHLVDIGVIRRISGGYLEPFWPIVMCVCSYMFKNVYAVRVFNIIMSSACIWIIYKITEEVSKSEKTALLSARLFAFLPVNIFVCCFPIKDIFLTFGVFYAFYIFLLMKNSKKTKTSQIIFCILLLWACYHTRGGVVELLIIFFSLYILLKFLRQKKYGEFFLSIFVFSIIFILIKDVLLDAFKVKIDHYGGTLDNEGNIVYLNITKMKDIYKLPFTIFFANLQPVTLKLFSLSKDGTMWLPIISKFNITMYPIAFGNIAYIFLKKKDLFFWLSTFIMYSAVIILSIGVFRHYLFLLPVQLINYSICVNDNPKLKQFFYAGSAALLMVMIFVSL